MKTIPTNALRAAAALTLLAGSALAQTADLKVHTFTPSTRVLEAGKSITVQLLLQNVGTRGTAAFRSGFYVSDNATITTRDDLVGTFTTQIPVLTGIRRTERVSMPVNLSASRRWFGIYLDNGNVVRELSETNNTASVPVRCRAVVDLVVDRLTTIGTTWGQGRTISMVGTVRNRGGLAVPRATRTGFYLSRDTDVTTADRLLVSATVERLLAGATITHSVRAMMPRDARLGACWIGCLADSTGAVTEFNELNNRRVVGGRCYAPGTITIFGKSCPGSSVNGTPMLTGSSATGNAQIGSSVLFRLNNGPKISAAIFVLGLSDQRWGALRLPFALRPFGGEACQLFVSMDAIQALATTATGRAGLSIPVPMRSSLVGASFFVQAACVDGRANALGLSWTNGVRTTIGSVR